MPQVSRIQLYPIKALDAVRVSEARVLASGALALDRQWALFDERGRPINGKNRPEVLRVRASYDPAALEVALDGHPFSLARDAAAIASWFSERLNERVELREDRETGFPDDTESPGPTFVSEGSLARVAAWFDLPLENVRRRFRANLECDGVEPFWEDRLYGGGFTIGSVHFDAVNPCQRCAVPSRDPSSAEPLTGFQRRFMERREAELPPGAVRSFFTHHYRLTVNTRVAPSRAGRIVREGDAVEACGDIARARAEADVQ
jgi:uncharacterized protein YcbX